MEDIFTAQDERVVIVNGPKIFQKSRRIRCGLEISDSLNVIGKRLYIGCINAMTKKVRLRHGKLAFFNVDNQTK